MPKLTAVEPATTRGTVSVTGVVWKIRVGGVDPAMQQIDEVWLSMCERVFGAARDLNAVKMISSLEENA